MADDLFFCSSAHFWRPLAAKLAPSVPYLWGPWPPDPHGQHATDHAGTPMVSTGHDIGHYSSPSKRRTGIRALFDFRAMLPWGFIFSEVGLLVLPWLTILFVFYDLHRCSGSIFNSPISQAVLKLSRNLKHYE